MRAQPLSPCPRRSSADRAPARSSERARGAAPRVARLPAAVHQQHRRRVVLAEDVGRERDALESLESGVARFHRAAFAPWNRKSSSSRASSTGASPCTLWPASFTCAIRALGQRRTQLRLVGVVDDRLLAHAAHEHQRNLDRRDHVPELGEARKLAAAIGLEEAPVAPDPASVAALLGVVQDPAPQRRHRSRRVVLDRAREQRFEVREALGAVDERRDRARLASGRRPASRRRARRRARARGTAARARAWSCRRATCPRRRARRGASSRITCATSRAFRWKFTVPSAA